MKIKNIIRTDKKVPMCDITIPDVHSYYLNGVVVHNSNKQKAEALLSVGIDTGAKSSDKEGATMALDKDSLEALAKKHKSKIDEYHKNPQKYDDEFKKSTKKGRRIPYEIISYLLERASLRKQLSSYTEKLSKINKGFINYNIFFAQCLTESSILLCKNKGFVSIKDVFIGDEIWTLDGWDRILDFIPQGEQNVYRVEFSDGRVITGTGSHPIQLKEGLTAMADLKKGDILQECDFTPELFFNASNIDFKVLYRHKDNVKNKDIILPQETTPEMCQLLGVLSSGEFSDNGIILNFWDQDKEMLDYYVDLITNIHNIKPKIKNEPKNNNVQVEIPYKVLSDYYKTLELLDDKVPEVVKRSGSEGILRYFSGYYDMFGLKFGDRYRLNSAYMNRLKELQTCLSLIGYKVHLVSLYDNKLLELRLQLKTVLNRWIKENTMVCSRKKPSEKTMKNISYDVEVVSVIRLFESQKTYDITLENQPLFFANGILTHNTGRLSSGGSSNEYFMPLNYQNLTKPKPAIYRAIYKDHPIYNTMLKDYDEILDYKFVEVKKNEYIFVYDKDGNKVLDDDGNPKKEIGIMLDDSGNPIEDTMYLVESTKKELNIRSAVTVPDVKTHLFVSMDFSMEEIVLAVNYSKEPSWLEPILKGQDIHKYMAIKMFGEENYDKMARKKAKFANFSLLYLGTWMALKSASKLPDLECQDIYEKFWKIMVTMKNWGQRLISNTILEKDGNVYSYFGRPRRLKYYLGNPDKQLRQFGERSVISHTIQGCLQKHVRILTNKGYIPIKELYDLECDGKLEGFQVWTGTKWATFNVLNRGLAQLAKLELKDGSTLDCDMRHEVLKHTLSSQLKSKFVKVTDLSNRSQLICKNHVGNGFDFPNPLPKVWVSNPKVHNSYKVEIHEQDLNDLWYWVGYWYGDGSWSGSYKNGTVRKVINFCFGHHEELKADSCVEFFKKWNPNIKKSYKKKKKYKPTINIEVNISGFVDYMLEVLKIKELSKAHTKRVPEILYRCPLEYRLRFIQGLFDSDGYKKGKNIHLCNYDLLNDVRQLCDISGIVTRLNGPFLSCGTSTLILGSSYGGLKPKVRKNNKLDSNYSYGSFHSLRPLDVYEETYTLSVHDEEHRFVSDGIISKNTGADIMRIVLVQLYKQIFSKKENLEEIQFSGCVHDEVNTVIRKDVIYKWYPVLKKIMEIKRDDWLLGLTTSFECGSSYGSLFPFEMDISGVFHPKRA